MPGYRTHLTASSVAGAALGTGSLFLGGVSIPSALMAASLCSVGGLVPDIDSKTSQSFRKCLALIAGFSSLLLVSRLRDFPLNAESVAMIGGGNFVLIWFFIGGLIKRVTVHRGMCHSIPMALLSAEIIFLLSSGPAEMRLFNAFALFLGVMIHLILDEFYSFEVDKTKMLPGVNVKKSFGSAIKLIDFDHRFSTAFIFVTLFILTNIVINEPVWTEDIAEDHSAASDRDELRGKREIEQVQKKYPHLYDLSVVEWVAENGLYLRPSTSDNQKWTELERLLDISQENENAAPMTASSRRIPLPRSAAAVSSSAATSTTSDGPARGAELLHLLSGEAQNQALPEGRTPPAPYFDDAYRPVARP